MQRRTIASKLMLIGGIIELLVALGHFYMPVELGRADAVQSLPAAYQSFLALGVVAVGLCQAVFGLLSLYFSQRILNGDRAAWVYGLSQGALWIGRTILEWVLPVEIPLFSIATPSALFIPLLPAIALLYLVPMLLFKRQLVADKQWFEGHKPMPKLQN